jgi:hypothetical protein
MEPFQNAHEEVLVGISDRLVRHCSCHGPPHVSLSAYLTNINADYFSLYVGIPHFAEDYINKYEYDYDGLEITNPRPTALHVKQKSSLAIGGGFSGGGHLDGFNATCRVKETNKVFAAFPVPQIAFGNGASLDIDQDLELTCVDCISQIAANAASNISSALLIEGASNLHLSGLPTAHLNIRKTMNVGSKFALYIISLRNRLTVFYQAITLQVRFENRYLSIKTIFNFHQNLSIPTKHSTSARLSCWTRQLMDTTSMPQFPFAIRVLSLSSWYEIAHQSRIREIEKRLTWLGTRIIQSHAGYEGFGLRCFALSIFGQTVQRYRGSWLD